MLETDLQIQLASSTATGRRPANQDAAIALDLRDSESIWGFQAVVGVADGMGGHAAGDVASRIAADTVTEVLGLCRGDESPLAVELAGTGAAEALLHAVQLANRRIYLQAKAEAEQFDMGTTLTVVALTTDTAIVAHVGDSRGYIIIGGGIHQVTQDHSWVARQVQEQRMTEEEAVRSPLRNQVTRTLGVAEEVVPDVVSIPLEPDTIYLVCSDGLTEVVTNEEMADAINSTASVSEACDALVGRALEHGARDNVTVACVEYGRIQRGQAVASAPTQQEITQQLYPTLRTRPSGVSRLSAQRLIMAGIAATAVLLLVSVLLLRSCILAPSLVPSAEEIEAMEERRPSVSMVELPPIEQGLTVKVLVINGALVAAANRHVELAITPTGAVDTEPRTTIGPDRDYTRALSDEEIDKWADATCQLTLWVQGDYVHWTTEPDNMDLYVNRRMRKDGVVSLAALGDEPVRISFYFPANQKNAYTVALTQVDAANLPAVKPDSQPLP